MIKLKNITKKFDGNPVLDNFCAEFDTAAYCVTGASGAGKTTLINIIMGLIRPDGGEVVFEGFKNTPPRFSAVFQEDRLCENISALKNVLLVCPDGFDKQVAVDALKRAGLSDSLYKPVRNCSGGQKRRVAIVRALLAESDIIIMDEPLKGFEAELKNDIIAFISEKTAGKTFIFITHEKSEAKLLNAKPYVFTKKGLNE